MKNLSPINESKDAVTKEYVDNKNFAGSTTPGGAAASAEKLNTARKINGVSFDGTKDITIPRSIKPMERITGTSGTSGYFRIAHINITGNYVNTPILLSYIQRNAKEATLFICFNGVNNIDPTLASFKGRTLRNQSIDAYIHKSAASTWDIYVKKVEAYDVLFVTDCRIRNDGTLITFDNTQVSTLPEGYVKAESEICLSSSGGTMNPDSEIVIPYGTTGRAAGLGRNGVRVYTTSNGSPWASGMNFYETDKETSLGAIGAYGRTDTLEYYYIGSYQNPMVKITPDGKITTAAGGNLLYDGSILGTSGEVSISGLADYSVVLINLNGAASTGFKYGVSAMIPISYLSKSADNIYRIYGGIPSSSYITSSGPQAAKDMGGYITASMPDKNTLELAMDSSGSAIGSVQIYSII